MGPGSPTPPPPDAPPPRPDLDVAAPTSVPGWIVPSVVGLGIVSALLIGWLVARPDHGEPGRYEAHGITFDYPVGWTLLPEREPFVPAGAPGPAFVVQLGFREPLDTVYVAQYRLEDMPSGGSLADRMERIVDDFATHAGMLVVQHVEQVDHQRLDAYRARLSGTVDGRAFQSLVFLVTDDRTLWSISCQSSEAHRRALEEGCALIVRSLKPTA